MRKIACSRGMAALVDDEDYDRLVIHNWHVVQGKQGTFYAARFKNKVKISMHDMIMGRRPGLIVDHRNHNGLDNRRENLRWATHAQNSYNMRKTRGTSRYKGVSWSNHKQRWKAVIGYNYRSITIGYFDTEEQAAAAYNERAIELYSDYAYLNVIENT